MFVFEHKVMFGLTKENKCFRIICGMNRKGAEFGHIPFQKEPVFVRLNDAVSSSSMFR